MNRKLIKELSGLGTNSLLVIGKSGLKRVYCPFRVICREPVLYHFPGDVLFVAQVKLTTDLMLAYQIDGLHYRHIYFEVLDP